MKTICLLFFAISFQIISAQSETQRTAATKSDSLKKIETAKVNTPDGTSKAKTFEKRKEIYSVSKSSCECNMDVPVYPGGEKKFQDTLCGIASKIITPKTEGTFIIQFEVDTAGVIFNPQVLKSVDTAYEKVIIANLDKVGKWVPACWTHPPLWDTEGEEDNLPQPVMDENNNLTGRTVTVVCSFLFHIRK